MKVVAPPPPVETQAVIDMFLMRELYPGVYAADVEPWEKLIRRPIWRHAKPLLAEHGARVHAVVDRLIEGQNGFPSAAIRMCKGKMLLEERSYPRALEIFSDLVDGNSGDFKALYNVGLCLAFLGRTAEARSAFEGVLRLQPRDARAIHELIPICLRAGETVRASELRGQLPDADPMRHPE